jgi:hypothetical protein
MIEVPRSVEILAPLVDYYAEINNPQNVDDVQLIKPADSTWEEFKRQWIQYVPFNVKGGCVLLPLCTISHHLSVVRCLFLVPRTVAYIPNRKKVLEKAEKAKLGLESSGGSSLSG